MPRMARRGTILSHDYDYESSRARAEKYFLPLDVNL